MQSIIKKLYHSIALMKNSIIEYGRKFIAPIRRRRISSPFCIISNNCWGGIVYQRYGMKYNSPTVGLYFFADEYIRFVSDLNRYINMPLRIIRPSQSKYYDELKKRNEESVPIGLIDDVEIVFLHYETPEEAVEKWEKRKKRIDYNHLIIKFSKMNQCEDKHLELFDRLDYKVKFAFNNEPNLELKSVVYIPGYDNRNQILDDTKHYSNYIDLEQLINYGIVRKK